MKIFCYLILVIGFFMFYQQNPLYALIVIGLFIAGFLFFKSRRSTSSGGGFLGFMKGNSQQNSRNIDDLVTLLMLQQLIGNHSNHKVDEPDSSHEERVEKIKQEILDILDE